MAESDVKNRGTRFRIRRVETNLPFPAPAANEFYVLPRLLELSPATPCAAEYR